MGFAVSTFRRRAAAFAAVALLACLFRLTAVATATAVKQAEATAHLTISGTQFLKPDGSVFEWRGITAFRLLEFVAHGREADADAYLAWAASKKLTVVRVFAMADGLFQLSPADGQHALPRLLEIAQRHGVYVEVVALTGTGTQKVDMPRFVQAIGAICARYPNALLEIANEPGHPSQAVPVHDAGYVRSLAQLVPKAVPVALGSVEYGDGFAAGAYVTWHAPRSGKGGWPAQVAEGAALAKRFKKPVVNDEPIGAADTAIPGRRDNDPQHFQQAAAATRHAGLGATFHYESGLQARPPTRIEMACLDAWLAGFSANR